MRCRLLFIERAPACALLAQGQAREKGVVFIVALAVVVIASIIATSCLIYISNHRERQARLADQDAKGIDLESEIRSAKDNIQHQAISSGQVDLSLLPPMASTQANRLSLSFSAPGIFDSVIRIPWLAGNSGEHDPATTVRLGQDIPSDPFSGAVAQVVKVAVDASAVEKTVSSSRIVNKTVTATPEIDIRRIPVSEFTVYSAGHSDLQLDQAVFPGGLGRVFAAGNVNLRGSLVSPYPLVSQGIVNGTGEGQVTFNAGSDSQPKITIDGPLGNPGDAGWINNARTRFAANVITPDVLPVDTAAAYNVYTPMESPGASQLNIVGLGSRCDLTVVARGQETPQVFWTHSRQPVIGFTRAAIGQASPKNAKRDPQKTPNVVVGTFSDEKGAQQTVLALNYATLPSGLPIQSCYLIVTNGAGVADPNALVLLRSADTLNRGFSVVTPNRLGVEGDFNVGSGDSVAASLITPQDVQAFPVGSFKQLGGAR
jgi:hypothetical protein